MKKTTTVIAAGTTALVLTLVGCDASEEFKASCKEAGGEVMRENDVPSILGMAPVGFAVGAKPPAPVVKVPSVKAPTTVKVPKSPAKAPTKAPTSGTNVVPPGVAPVAAGKSNKKSSDNDWVCVKNGKILFEEN